jgi:pimeloyl-ACP methyl ester carboxylesterase
VVAMMTVTLSPISHLGVAAAEPLELSGILWSPCPEDPTADCAMVETEFDYNLPGSGTVELSVKRYRATGLSTERIGVLVYNPGGPGLSAVDALSGFAYAVGEDVASKFDLVAVDPRGVGGSMPIKCTPETFHPTMSFSVMPTNATQLHEQVAVLDPWLRSKCSNSEADLDHMGTIDAARDIDRVRQALGESQINFYGVSYGSLLGIIYATMYPNQVRAMVFDSAINPDSFSVETSSQTLWNRMGAHKAAYNAFWAAMERCEQLGTEMCFMSDVLRASYLHLINYLERSPLFIEGYGWYDLSAFQSTAVSLMNGFDGQGISDYSILFELIVALAEIASTQEGIDNDSFSVERLDLSDRLMIVNSTTCIDAAWPRTIEELQIDAASAESEAPGFGYYWTSMGSACVGWPDTSSGNVGSILAKGKIATPLLVLVNEHDPITDGVSAQHAADVSTESVVVTVKDSWGHAVIGRSKCADDANTEFLLRLTPPEVTTCAPDAPLFGMGDDTTEPVSLDLAVVATTARLDLGQLPEAALTLSLADETESWSEIAVDNEVIMAHGVLYGSAVPFLPDTDTSNATVLAELDLPITVPLADKSPVTTQISAPADVQVAGGTYWSWVWQIRRSDQSPATAVRLASDVTTTLGSSESSGIAPMQLVVTGEQPSRFQARGIAPTADVTISLADGTVQWLPATDGSPAAVTVVGTYYGGSDSTFVLSDNPPQGLVPLGTVSAQVTLPTSGNAPVTLPVRADFTVPTAQYGVWVWSLNRSAQTEAAAFVLASDASDSFGRPDATSVTPMSLSVHFQTIAAQVTTLPGQTLKLCGKVWLEQAPGDLWLHRWGDTTLVPVNVNGAVYQADGAQTPKLALGPNDRPLRTFELSFTAAGSNQAQTVCYETTDGQAGVYGFQFGVDRNEQPQELRGYLYSDSQTWLWATGGSTVVRTALPASGTTVDARAAVTAMLLVAAGAFACGAAGRIRHRPRRPVT